MKPTRVMIAVATMAVVVYLTACSRTDNKAAGSQEKVTIAITSTTDSALAQVAQAKGYFREEGVDAAVHLQPYGKPALQEVLDGKADFATVAETPVMFAIMSGAKLGVLATIESSRKANIIVARRDRGISTLGDLTGKRVATTRGTTSDYFLDAILAVNGIARDKLQVIDMKAEEMKSALANGEIDAISTFNTYAIPAQRVLGERGISFYDENVYTSTFNIVAKQEFITNNPGKVRKMLLALMKAEELVKQNPAEAQKLVADFSGVDIAILRDMWNDTSFHVALDQVLILALEDECRWAIRNKLTKATNIPNFLDYIHLDGLKGIKPDAVRIMR